jgi:hypothetical protein
MFISNLCDLSIFTLSAFGFLLSLSILIIKLKDDIASYISMMLRNNAYSKYKWIGYELNEEEKETFHKYINYLHQFGVLNLGEYTYKIAFNKIVETNLKTKKTFNLNYAQFSFKIIEHILNNKLI